MKKGQFQDLIAAVQGLVETEGDLIAGLANSAAVIHAHFDAWWTGFYLVKGSSPNTELVLGPFQGPVACTRIQFGKGVCGKAWESKTSQVVEDVHQFEGHIACSAESNSEIVVPILVDKQVVAVLDIDSVEFGAFDEQDRIHLEEITAILAKLFQHAV